MADSVYVGWFGPTQGNSSGSAGPVFPSITTTGQFIGANGSASLPSFAFTSDPTTGMYRNAAGQIGFTGSGARIGVLSSSGLATSGLFLDITNQDVALTRGAANRLDLMSGDSFNIVSGSLTVGGAASATQFTSSATDFLIAKSGTLVNGAAAQLGTLTNAPVAGNPTKWVAINDNGTTRHLPAW